MMDKALATFSFLVLVAFLSILIWHVRRIDLAAVILLTIVLAGYDFIGSLRRKRGGG